MLPKHECKVAESAPGKQLNSLAPGILRAKTTASAEFCIPVSIEMVRLVRSENPVFRGIKYPTPNPIVCSKHTAPSSWGRDTPCIPPRREAFCATTPPQIMATSKTLRKGVKRETNVHNPGALLLRIIPSATGSSTTCEVARHNAHPLTDTRLPTIPFTSRGVRTDASTVEQVVRSTERATSAPAIKDTRLEAVPPGEHPTSANPRNRALFEFNTVFPTRSAERGMMANWHTTPAGTAFQLLPSVF
mmetsp:Transcript_15131/g.18409  ORF Transcript_15131/g.18409 Transcript_15131/m.18409 type:complete len:246 (-) Transcript_15131:538-1275(-)